VEIRRQITEEDILITEALIARSYGRLKRSVVQAPSQVLSSMGKTIAQHPFATAAAAGGAGITLYELFRLMNKQGAVKENVAGSREQKCRPDMRMEILAMIIPIVAPYIAGYLQKYVGKIFSGDWD
jgi:hypothetical protein